jgi:hypothetical protein
MRSLSVGVTASQLTIAAIRIKPAFGQETLASFHVHMLASSTTHAPAIQNLMMLAVTR